MPHYARSIAPELGNGWLWASLVGRSVVAWHTALLVCQGGLRLGL